MKTSHLTYLTLSILAVMGQFLPALRADTLRLSVASGYLSGIPILARVELVGNDGQVNREIWDAEAVLTADRPDVALSTNRVILKNGLGSVLLAVTGTAPFNLQATSAGLQATRSLSNLSSAPVTWAGGTLPADNLAWSGVVRMTNDVTVPSGGSLTIASGTLVVISGVSSGTTAPDLIVNGALHVLGTAEDPVTLTCASASQRWGQIRHSNASPSQYRYASITRAGRAPGEGHTGTGPVLRLSNSEVSFESCNLTDHAETSGTPGKIMYALSSKVEFDNCLLARARMGPEVAGTAIVSSNTWFMEMRGPDDSDGIYIHTQSPGQVALLSRCVLAGGDDDGLDTLGSDVVLEDCIIRDWPNPSEDAKGISVFHGTTTVRGSLIANCFVGISAKSSGPHARVNVVNSTVTGITRGIAAAYKSNATVGNILFLVTNTIVRSADAVYTDFGATNFNIGFCNLSEPWPGEANLTGDPLFVDGLTNYHLTLASPCIDAGDPALALDPDNTLPDVGAFPVAQDRLLPASPVTIQEIMYHAQVESADRPDLDFIELRNISADAVPLFDTSYPSNTWRLGGSIQFSFPTNTTLPGYHTLLVVGFDSSAAGSNLDQFRAAYGIPATVPVFGPFEGGLGNTSGTVTLRRPVIWLEPDSTVVYSLADQVTYSNAFPWPSILSGTDLSLQRTTPVLYGNAPTNWYAAQPSAGLPNSGDSDGDSIPDVWEDLNGLDKYGNDAQLDYDQDHLTNWQEYLAGTDPKDPGSALRWLDAVPLRAGARLRFQAAAGKSYTVQYSSVSTGGSWQTFTNISALPTASVIEVEDPGSLNGQRFYRLVTPALD